MTALPMEEYGSIYHVNSLRTDKITTPKQNTPVGGGGGGVDMFALGWNVVELHGIRVKRMKHAIFRLKQYASYLC